MFIQSVSAKAVAVRGDLEELKKNIPKVLDEPLKAALEEIRGAVKDARIALKKDLFLYSSKSFIIIGAGVTPTCGSGESHVAGTEKAPETHIIDMSLPNGSSITGAWYTPTDEIRKLGNYKLIEVTVSPDKHQVVLRIASAPGAECMRIQVHCTYSRE